MISSDLNAAYDTVGKKMFGGSKALDMSNILIYKGDLENLERGKKRRSWEERDVKALQITSHGGCDMTSGPWVERKWLLLIMFH